MVMAGPATEPFPEEMNKLDAYLNAGGSVLLMLDPPPAATLKDFTEKWSVAVGNNRVIDITGMGQLLGKGPDTPLVTNYGQHQIVDRFNLMTFFPVARSVSPSKAPVAGLTAEPLIETASQSWGESDLKSNSVGFDEKVDVKGPVPIATVVTKDASEGQKARMIVFGDSDFAINANFSNQGNGNLFVNTVKWLARDENLISIKTKDPTDRPLTMTESGGTPFGILVCDSLSRRRPCCRYPRLGETEEIVRFKGTLASAALSSRSWRLRLFQRLLQQEERQKQEDVEEETVRRRSKRRCRKSRSNTKAKPSAGVRKGEKDWEITSPAGSRGRCGNLGAIGIQLCGNPQG